MAKKKKEVKKKKFSHEMLVKALFHIDDLMDRCVLGNTYILLKDTAKAAKEDIFLEGDGIDIGVEKRYLTPEVMSTLRVYITDADVDEDEGFEYTLNEVPVRVRYIKKKYKFLKNPEPLVYNFEDFQVANPFDKYWKARFLVR